MGAGTLSDSYTPEAHRLLKRAKAARQVLERDDVDPALLLSYVVWPSEVAEERERAIAALEVRKVAKESSPRRIPLATASRLSSQRARTRPRRR